MAKNNDKRKISNEQIISYEPMVEKFIRDSCVKNWSQSRQAGPSAFLGSSGFALEDLRQYLRTEICVALQNYDPNYRTKDNKSVKESTFVYQHLTFRIGQMMKRLTKKRMGYGIHHNQFETILKSGVEEHSVVDIDHIMSIDTRQQLMAKQKSQVAQFLEKKYKF